MPPKAATPDTALRITRRINASCQQVFQAWTDPEALKRWFAPSGDFTIPSVDVDLRVGGRYRIHMKDPVGKNHIVCGVFHEISVPTKLVYTWEWEAGQCGSDDVMVGETLVTVEFHAREDTTELILTHEKFSSAHERDRHYEGWTGCLSQLPRAL